MICVKCGEDKSENEFSFKSLSKGIQSPHCKVCKAQFQKAWYEKNKDRHKNNTRQRSNRVGKENRVWVNTLKNNPCLDCNQIFHPECMDFDHLNDKKIDISKMIRAGYSKDTILAEIVKCELVCANCHRLRTYKRRHGLGA